MRRFLICLGALTAATGAAAQGAPSTLEMTCAQARRLVETQGAVVLRTGPQLFDRYVANPGFCRLREMIEPVWVPAADTSQCAIGYRCRAEQLWREE